MDDSFGGGSRGALGAPCFQCEGLFARNKEPAGRHHFSLLGSEYGAALRTGERVGKICLVCRPEGVACVPLTPSPASTTTTPGTTPADPEAAPASSAAGPGPSSTEHRGQDQAAQASGSSDAADLPPGLADAVARRVRDSQAAQQSAASTSRAARADGASTSYAPAYARAPRAIQSGRCHATT